MLAIVLLLLLYSLFFFNSHPKICLLISERVEGNQTCNLLVNRMMLQPTYPAMVLLYILVGSVTS